MHRQANESSAHARDQQGDGDHGDEHAHPLSPIEVARIVFVGLTVGALILIGKHSWPATLSVEILATIVGGWPMFREALENLLEKRMTMELSMTIALGAALATGQFFTASVIIFFVLIAEVLEGLTVGRGERD